MGEHNGEEESEFTYIIGALIVLYFVLTATLTPIILVGYILFGE